MSLRYFGTRPRPEGCAIRNGHSVHFCVLTRLVQGVGDWRHPSGAPRSYRHGRPVQVCVPTRLVQGVGDWKPLSGGFHSLEFLSQTPPSATSQGYRILRIFPHAILAARARGGLPRFFLGGRQTTGRDAAVSRCCGLRDGVISTNASEGRRGVERPGSGFTQAALFLAAGLRDEE